MESLKTQQDAEEVELEEDSDSDFVPVKKTRAYEPKKNEIQSKLIESE